MVLSSKYHNLLQDKQNALDEQVDDEVVDVMMSAVPTTSTFASPRVENIHVELERSLPPTPVQDDDEEDEKDEKDVVDDEEGAEGDKEQNEYNWDSKVVDILLGGSRTGSRTPVQEEDEGNDDEFDAGGDRARRWTKAVAAARRQRRAGRRSALQTPR